MSAVHALIDLLHDESTRKMAGLQLYVDENFASRPVDDILALAVRHHFVPVIGEELVQECQRILDTGWFVLLACLVVDGRSHEIARIERRQNDPLQYWRIVELAQAVFRECPARRKTLTIRVVGEIVEKSDEFGP